MSPKRGPDGEAKMKRVVVNGMIAAVVATGVSVITEISETPKAAEAATTTAQVARAKRVRVVRLALAQRGKPYRFGAQGPSAYDCSGLTKYTYRRAAGRKLPRTTTAQRRNGYWTRHPQRGDLVFWGSYHVGIYIGNHRVVHAPQPGSRVKVAHIWGHPRYKRLI